MDSFGYVYEGHEPKNGLFFFQPFFGLADRQTFKLTPVCTCVRAYVTRYLSIRSLVFSDTLQLGRALAM